VNNYTIDQFINIQQIEQLLEAHVRISGIACGLMDNDANIIIGTGLQQVCTEFLWENPASFARCCRNDPDIKKELHAFSCDRYECRCKNGMVNIAMPIIIEGNCIGILFSGQFFYSDDSPDLVWFQQQSDELGFDPETYLAAVRLAPVLSRSHVDNTMRFLHQLVQLLADTGYTNFMRGRELDQRKRIDREHFVFTGAINNAIDAFFLIDAQHRFQYVNDAACRSLGYSREELLTMGTIDIDPDMSPDTLAALRDNAYKNSILKPFETRHRTKDGLIFPVEISLTPFMFDGVKLGLYMARDITQRKQVDQQINLLNYALDNIHEAAYLIVDGRFMYVNQEACRSLGYSRDELIGMQVLDIDASFTPERANEHVVDLFRQGTLTFETLHRTSAGRIFPVEITSSLFNYGTTQYVLSLVRNISERKRMEAELAEQEQQFRSLAESSPDFIIRYDLEHRICYLNNLLRCELRLSNVEEVIGRRPCEVWPDGRFTAIDDAAAQAINTGSAVTIERTVPINAGETAYRQITVVPERGVDGQLIGTIAFGRDITERKLAKLELLEKQQRLNDMALKLTLSEERERRRIAVDLHDTLGQDLTLTRMKVGGLNKTELSVEQNKLVSEIKGLTEGAINRVRSLTRLLSPPVLESAGLEAALKWLARQMETDYSLQITFSDDLQDKTVSREIQIELYKSVRELLINVAKHADTDTVCLSVSREADTLAIRVEDDGSGFDADAFWDSPGSDGFGLFTIKRRIVLMGGTFEINSKLGSGTEITISVPLSGQSAPVNTKENNHEH